LIAKGEDRCKSGAAAARISAGGIGGTGLELEAEEWVISMPRIIGARNHEVLTRG
jgi:hypothetical protein